MTGRAIGTAMSDSRCRASAKAVITPATNMGAALATIQLTWILP